MTFKKELIALAVRILANETTLVRKTEPSAVFWNSMFGIESDEQRMSRNIEAELDRVTATVKSAKINRKFKKITEAY